MSKKIIVSGVGCCLVDLLYSNIKFSSTTFQKYISLHRGDGGLTPGQLVFNEEFVQFTGTPFETLVHEITQGRTPDKINIGGPSIVSLIHAAQMTDCHTCEIRFYGKAGNDQAGKYLVNALAKTPIVLHDFTMSENITPSTVVLSDPTYNNGHGERTFINSIGAAWDYRPEHLDEAFFKSDIVVFGGTALVPEIHDGLTELLKKSKANGCMTIVNTVFDFRNEKQNPDKKWPLGNSDESYAYIDLLIADQEEALRLSDKTTTEAAIAFFIDKKVSAFIVTNGSNPIMVFSNGKLFETRELTKYAVSQRIVEELKTNKSGDTTGAGDNFVGGVIASLVNQLQAGNKTLNLQEAASWGIVSGGYACFYMGGTFFEQLSGEKLSNIKPYYESYKQQLYG
jgi:sugar/nucleoside kinase (ribokinase family)